MFCFCVYAAIEQQLRTNFYFVLYSKLRVVVVVEIFIIFIEPRIFFLYSFVVVFMLVLVKKKVILANHLSNCKKKNE